MVGYLSFLKIGPKLLKFLPGEKARDLRNWLTVYGYWNQGGLSNCVSMFTYLVQQYLQPPGAGAAPPLKPPVETPALGCLHPDYEGYFPSPAAYMQWYRSLGPLAGTGAPLVAVLLYRKHVITEQPYIRQLISQMEGEGAPSDAAAMGCPMQSRVPSAQHLGCCTNLQQSLLWSNFINRRCF